MDATPAPRRVADAGGAMPKKMVKEDRAVEPARFSRRLENGQERFPLLPTEICSLGDLLEAPLPDRLRECAAIDRALASNLEVFGRGLAAIGNFFVFHRLSFVKRRKTSFLYRRNMNKHIFAAT